MNTIEGIRDLIKSIQPVAYRKPGLAIKVASAIVDKSEGLYDGKYEEVRQNVGSELSELIPIIEAAVAADRDLTAGAMETLYRLHRNKLVDTPYDNRKAIEGLKTICSYRIDLTMEHTLSAVETLEKWISEDDDGRQALAVELAGNLLTITATAEYSDAATFTWSSLPIAITPTLEEVRARVIKVILGALEKANSKILLTAIRATWNLGEARFGHYQDADSDLSELVNHESEILIDAFRGVLAKGPTFGAAAAIEHQLWSWWCNGPTKISQLCEQAIQELPSGAEYSLWKALFSGDLPIHTSLPSEDLAKGERKDRNEYYHDYRGLTETSSKGHFEPLFAEISKSRGSAKEWVALFDELGSENDSDYSWRARHPIFDLAVYDPQLGWDIVELLQEHALLPIICEPLLASLRSVDLKHWDEKLLANFDIDSLDLRTKYQSEIPWITALWGQQNLTTIETRFLEGLTRHSDVGVRRQAAGALGHAKSSGENDTIIHLVDVVQENPTDVVMWHSLFAAFDTWLRNVSDPKKVAPPSAIFDLIRYSGDKPELARYRSDTGVTVFLRSVAKVWPQALAELIEHVWRDASGAGRKGRSSGILNDWHVEDTLRYLDSPEEKKVWAEILRSWIVDQKITADLAVICIPNVADLADPAQSDFILSLASDSDPVSFSRVRDMMWNYKSSDRFLDVMVELLKTTHESNEDHFKKIGQALIGDIPYCSTGRTVGQTSPVDVSLVKQLTNLLAEPGLAIAIRDILQKALHGLEQNIEQQLQEDEERFRE